MSCTCSGSPGDRDFTPARGCPSHGGPSDVEPVLRKAIKVMHDNVTTPTITAQVNTRFGEDTWLKADLFVLATGDIGVRREVDAAPFKLQDGTEIKLTDFSLLRITAGELRQLATALDALETGWA